MLRKFGKKPRASKQMAADRQRVAVAAWRAFLVFRLAADDVRIG
jgi:hypothetical protein